MDASYTGKMIAQLRKEKGLTQKELASLVYVTDKAVSKWERGINFPELSLLEKLAAELGTTPSHLLGIEDATHEEIVSSFTQISAEQAQEAKTDLCRLGWISLVIAIILAVTSHFISIRLQRNGLYFDSRLLLSLINASSVILAGGGIFLLFKHGAIKKFDTAEILLVYAIAISVLTYLGIQFFTGRGPSKALACVLLCIAACSVQWLFYRIMQPQAAKAVPLILSAAFAVWSIFNFLALHTWNGTVGGLFIYKLSPFLSCLAVWCVSRYFDKEKSKISAKKLCLYLLAALAVSLYLGRDYAAQLYVRTFQSSMENYAEEKLSQGSGPYSDRYGLWKVSIDPADDMVEFSTGGSGLAPSSTYKGFYYSPDDTHKAFGGADVLLEISGDTATWLEEGTDNHGVSIRITKNWFWYEASF